MAAKESDQPFDLRAKYGTICRPDKNFKALEFFDKTKDDLYLHRLLDSSRARSAKAKVGEVSCERDFSLTGRVFGPLRARMATALQSDFKDDQALRTTQDAPPQDTPPHLQLSSVFLKA
jgi:hypothetical protein